MVSDMLSDIVALVSLGVSPTANGGVVWKIKCEKNSEKISEQDPNY